MKKLDEVDDVKPLEAVFVPPHGRGFHKGPLIKIAYIPKARGRHRQNIEQQLSRPFFTSFFPLFPPLSPFYCLPRSCSAELLARS